MNKIFLLFFLMVFCLAQQVICQGKSQKRIIDYGNHLSDQQITDLNEQIISSSLLIINTTPLGTFPNIYDCPNIPYQYLTPQHFLYDLVYNPAQTLFLQKGEQHGTSTKNGYDMLVIQAEESWRIWNSS